MRVGRGVMDRTYNINLWEEKDEHGRIQGCWAKIENDCLIISKERLYSSYMCFFDPENTKQLFALLDVNNGPRDSILVSRFGGADGFTALLELCKTNGINYASHIE